MPSCQNQGVGVGGHLKIVCEQNNDSRVFKIYSPGLLHVTFKRCSFKSMLLYEVENSAFSYCCPKII